MFDSLTLVGRAAQVALRFRVRPGTLASGCLLRCVWMTAKRQAYRGRVPCPQAGSGSGRYPGTMDPLWFRSRARACTPGPARSSMPLVKSAGWPGRKPDSR